MAAGFQMGGPSPWWTQPGYNQPGKNGQGTVQNLQNQSPSGYQYDPIKMGYSRTPESIGTDAGTAVAAFNKIVPPYGGNSSSSASGSGSGSQFPTIQYPGGGGPGAPGGGGGVSAPREALNIPDTSAASAAAFARAKDKVGQTTQGAITGLRSSLGGRGMLGSGAETHGVTHAFTQGQGQLGEVARSQAMSDADLAERQSELSYTGGISQRGQDLASQQAAAALAAQIAQSQYSGQITQRGQDIAASGQNRQFNLLAQSQQQAQWDRILSALNLSY
jgi:hypothetical protein